MIQLELVQEMVQPVAATLRLAVLLKPVALLLELLALVLELVQETAPVKPRRELARYHSVVHPCHDRLQ